MKNDKVYLYHGTMDYAVTEGIFIYLNNRHSNQWPIYYIGVVKRNEDFYKNYLSDSQIKKVYNYASSHGFVRLILSISWCRSNLLFNLRLQIILERVAMCYHHQITLTIVITIRLMTC